MQLRKRAKRTVKWYAALAGIDAADVERFIRSKREEQSKAHLPFNPVLQSKPTVRDYTHGD